MGRITRLTHCGVVLCCLLPGASVPAPQASSGQSGATVTETLLGPRKPAGQFVVSPDGGHLATFSTHGSREVIIIDGVDGPEFDDAGRPNPGSGVIDVAFSPDGKRSAYISQKGDLWVAVVDGKEAFTVASVKLEPTVPGIDQTYIHAAGLGRLVPKQFLFSESGAHHAVVSHEGNVWHLFLDGVKSPAYDEIDLRQVAFAGDRLVYAAATPDKRWHMVVNSVAGPAYDRVSSLQLSDNNQHYAFIGQTGVNTVIVTGGATGAALPPITAPGARELVVASNGRVGYLANGPAGSTQPLYVGTQMVTPDAASFFGTYPATGEQRSVFLAFSPDGSKFAYAKRVPGGFAAVIDGKESIAYDGIGQMHFGPDSRRAYFVGMKSGINFVVIDGQEMPAKDMVKNLLFSQDGSRFGYEAATTVVVDGKESAALRELIDKSLVFSADGKHSAYVSCSQYTQCQAVRDGVGSNIARPADFIARTGQPRIVFPGIFFSPDGTRLVTNMDAHAVLIDGKEVLRGATYEFPTFSPDSKHFVVMGWTGRGMTLYVDGAAGPAYDDIIEGSRNAVRFLDPHTLRFLAVKGGSVYRVLVDLK